MVVPQLGWSIQDVIALLDYSRKVCIAFRDAPKELQELAGQFELTHEVFTGLIEILEKLNRPLPCGEDRFRKTIERCEVFLEKHKHLQDSKITAAKIGKALAWPLDSTSKEIASLKGDLLYYAVIFNLYVQQLTLTRTFFADRMLNWEQRTRNLNPSDAFSRIIKRPDVGTRNQSLSHIHPSDYPEQVARKTPAWPERPESWDKLSKDLTICKTILCDAKRQYLQDQAKDAALVDPEDLESIEDMLGDVQGMIERATNMTKRLENASHPLPAHCAPKKHQAAELDKTLSSALLQSENVDTRPPAGLGILVEEHDELHVDHPLARSKFTTRSWQRDSGIDLMSTENAGLEASYTPPSISPSRSPSSTQQYSPYFHPASEFGDDVNGPQATPLTTPPPSWPTLQQRPSSSSATGRVELCSNVHVDVPSRRRISRCRIEYALHPINGITLFITNDETNGEIMHKFDPSRQHIPCDAYRRGVRASEKYQTTFDPHYAAMQTSHGTKSSKQIATYIFADAADQKRFSELFYGRTLLGAWDIHEVETSENGKAHSRRLQLWRDDTGSIWLLVQARIDSNALTPLTFIEETKSAFQPIDTKSKNSKGDTLKLCFTDEARTAAESTIAERRLSNRDRRRSSSSSISKKSIDWRLTDPSGVATTATLKWIRLTFFEGTSDKQEFLTIWESG